MHLFTLPLFVLALRLRLIRVCSRQGVVATSNRKPPLRRRGGTKRTLMSRVSSRWIRLRFVCHRSPPDAETPSRSPMIHCAAFDSSWAIPCNTLSNAMLNPCQPDPAPRRALTPPSLSYAWQRRRTVHNRPVRFADADDTSSDMAHIASLRARLTVSACRWRYPIPIHPPR